MEAASAESLADSTVPFSTMVPLTAFRVTFALGSSALMAVAAPSSSMSTRTTKFMISSPVGPVKNTLVAPTFLAMT